MFDKNIMNCVEKVVDMSNFWLLAEVEKVNFRHKIHKSMNCNYETCRIDEETDLISRKKTYWVEISKNDGRILTKVCRTLSDLYEFLQWHTA